MPRGRPFPPGQSGNPAGMKPGTLHRLTREARRIAGKDGPTIIEKVAADAQAGDRAAQTLFLRFLLPRAQIINGLEPFNLPKLDSASDVPAAIRSVIDAMAAGSLTPADATSIVAGLEAYGRSSVFDGHEARLQALEALLAKQSEGGSA